MATRMANRLDRVAGLPRGRPHERCDADPGQISNTLRPWTTRRSWVGVYAVGAGFDAHAADPLGGRECGSLSRNSVLDGLRVSGLKRHAYRLWASAFSRGRERDGDRCFLPLVLCAGRLPMPRGRDHRGINSTGLPGTTCRRWRRLAWTARWRSARRRPGRPRTRRDKVVIPPLQETPNGSTGDRRLAALESVLRPPKVAVLAGASGRRFRRSIARSRRCRWASATPKATPTTTSGTARTLFAALDIATGEVFGLCRKRHRHEEFRRSCG